MNRLLARSVLRRCLFENGRNLAGKSMLQSPELPAAAAAAMVADLRMFSFSPAVMDRDQDFGSFKWRRMMSSAAEPASSSKAADAAVKEDEAKSEKKEGGGGREVAVPSYWGISRSKITREDGTEWPWNCFMPWDAYQSDLSIDLSKHHVPKNFVDKFAFRTVKLLRIPTDLFFRRRYGCRAMMLETVAAVPGMVGGMLLHLRSLRKFQESGGWIKALLEEAENERMHLMTMVELVQPKWYERILVLAVQGVFFNMFFVVYILSPKLAHRIVGYLEEEAIHSYTEFLKDIESGAIENVAAPAIAIDYWRLPKDSTLKDVITVIRADEAHHRDVNHFASEVDKPPPSLYKFRGCLAYKVVGTMHSLQLQRDLEFIQREVGIKSGVNTELICEVGTGAEVQVSVFVVDRDEDFGNFFKWRRRRMCTKSAAEPAMKAPSLKQAEVAAEKKEESEPLSYWGIPKSKITREDGTPWPWKCFMPWDTYHSDLSIDLTKHHVPRCFGDKFALRTVKLMRLPTDIFFKRRYGCRAMMLETVAAVPGMVGGMLLHLRSLRKFQQSGGWIKTLLEEAENERMHLMTMVELVKPKWYERVLVLTVQGIFFNLFFVVYILSPKLAHRIVGYLEEEAIHSYTEFLKDIDSGAIKNVAAPAIAIDYWRLSKDATLKDVVTVIRADEAHHRDVNHYASDIHFQGKELREAPAPIGYH
ncbi:hypothetical protein OSB04_030816 [Centaurea solstitialis]|uniref:Ubiquinol oxidase n=1 Tax=Centaurea solstitialis TaxID=347529 RepID=A0AA38SFW7_9ASTR|nr:hypothetical protein OSB04_030816 [Centaurea solstitialis]